MKDQTSDELENVLNLGNNSTHTAESEQKYFSYWIPMGDLLDKIYRRRMGDRHPSLEIYTITEIDYIVCTSPTQGSA